MRAALLVVLAAGMAFAAAPPARLTAEQEKLLRERPWFGVDGKTLEIELRVYGPWHRQVERTADRLGDQYQARGKWAREADLRRIVIEARRRLDGERHWRAADARLDLAEALAQAKRTPAQREALERAGVLNGQAVSLFHKGEAARAVPLAKQALKLTEEVQGRRHPHYADGLSGLAVMHHAMGD